MFLQNWLHGIRRPNRVGPFTTSRRSSPKRQRTMDRTMPAAIEVFEPRQLLSGETLDSGLGAIDIPEGSDGPIKIEISESGFPIAYPGLPEFLPGDTFGYFGGSATPFVLILNTDGPAPSDTNYWVPWLDPTQETVSWPEGLTPTELSNARVIADRVDKATRAIGVDITHSTSDALSIISVKSYSGQMARLLASNNPYDALQLTTYSLGDGLEAKRSSQLAYNGPNFQTALNDFWWQLGSYAPGLVDPQNLKLAERVDQVLSAIEEVRKFFQNTDFARNIETYSPLLKPLRYVAGTATTLQDAAVTFRVCDNALRGIPQSLTYEDARSVVSFVTRFLPGGAAIHGVIEADEILDLIPGYPGFRDELLSLVQPLGLTIPGGAATADSGGGPANLPKTDFASPFRGTSQLQGSQLQIIGSELREDVRVTQEADWLVLRQRGVVVRRMNASLVQTVTFEGGGDHDYFLNATPFASTLNGGAGNDSLIGGWGNDEVRGDLGNDHLWGGEGTDRLFGSDDNDTLNGELGADTLHGEAGDDSLIGAGGDDEEWGELGSDQVWGGEGNDWLFGGDDSDSVFGETGADTLEGGGGADKVDGGAGGDSLNGGEAADTLYGHAGVDFLFGSEGDDQLFGGSDSDVLDGGEGTDSLRGGRGADYLFGGPGSDLIYGDDGIDTAGFDSTDAIVDGIDTPYMIGLRPYLIGTRDGEPILTLDQLRSAESPNDTVSGGADDDSGSESDSSSTDSVTSRTLELPIVDLAITPNDAAQQNVGWNTTNLTLQTLVESVKAGGERIYFFHAVFHGTESGWVKFQGSGRDGQGYVDYFDDDLPVTSGTNITLEMTGNGWLRWMNPGDSVAFRAHVHLDPNLATGAEKLLTVSARPQEALSPADLVQARVQAIANTAPVVQDVPWQYFAPNETTRTITLAARDLQGDPVTYEVRRVYSSDPFAKSVLRQYGITEQSFDESNSIAPYLRWFKAGDQRYYLTTGGGLYRANGGPTSWSAGPQVALLNSRYYANPEFLFRDVAGNMTVSGNQLTITREPGFNGTMVAHVFGWDGALSYGIDVRAIFTEQASILEPIADQMLMHAPATLTLPINTQPGFETDVELTASIADIGTTPFAPAVVAMNNDQLKITPLSGFVGSFRVNVSARHGLQGDSQSFTVTVTNAVPQLVPLAPVRLTYEQTTSVIELVPSDLDGDAVALSVEVPTSQVTATVIGTQLRVTVAPDFFEPFTLKVKVTDGLSTTEQSVSISRDAFPTLPLSGLDYQFGEGGVARIDAQGYREQANDVVIQDDGKIVAVGQAIFMDRFYLPQVVLARLNADGTRDTEFGHDGVTLSDWYKYYTSVGRVVALQGDKILIAGWAYWGESSQDNFTLMRFNADGSRDFSFGNNGFANYGYRYWTDDQAWDMAVLADGSIALTGTAITNGAGIPIVRFSADGQVLWATDFQFGQPYEMGHALAALPNGGMLLGGASSLAKLQLNGQPDSTFGVSGKVLNVFGERGGTIQKIVVQPDGTIVVAGETDLANGTNRDLAVVRYWPDGRLDTTFGNDGRVFLDSWDNARYSLGDVVIRPDGSILLAGTTERAGQSAATLVQLTPQGRLDTAFGNDGWFLTKQPNGAASANAVVLQSNGAIVIAGSAGREHDSDFFVARFAGEGTGVPLNYPPRLLPLPNVSTRSSERTRTILLPATDRNHDALTFSATVRTPNGSTPPVEVSVLEDRLTLNWASGFVSEFVVDVCVSDGELSDTSSFTVKVTNTAPMVEIGSLSNGVEGQAIIVIATIEDADPGDDPFGLWEVRDHAGQVVATGTGSELRFTPEDDGIYEVRLTASDLAGSIGQDAALVVIANAAPTADAGEDLEASKRDVITFTGRASDAGRNDTLTFLWQLFDSEGRLMATASDVQMTFQPTSVGLFSAIFTVCDEDGACSTDTRFIRVQNHAPLVRSDAFSIHEDSTLTVTGAGVLENDSDADDDQLTALLVSSPIHGTLEFQADGTFTYMPLAEFSGSDSFTYKVNDGDLDSDLATVRLTVTAVNDVPVSVNDRDIAVEAGGVGNGKSGMNPTGNVLANDTDVDAGDTSTISAVSCGETNGAVGTALAGSFGSLTLNSDGTYRYAVDNLNPTVQSLRTPTDQLLDTFHYTVRDSAGATSSATLTITISGANDAPTGTTLLDQRVSVGQSLNFAIPINAFNDVDTGDTLTITATKFDGTPLPSWLSLDSETGRFSGTPMATDLGLTNIRVTATDRAGLSTDISSKLTVTPLVDLVFAMPATSTSPITAKVVSGRIQASGIGLQVQSNGVVVPNATGIESSWIRSITINGGAGGDTIDLAGLSKSTYTSLVWISLNGLGGNDTITGSADFGETISGGIGNDVLSGGGGTGIDQLVESVGPATSPTAVTVILKAVKGATNKFKMSGFGTDSIDSFEEMSLTGGADKDNINVSPFVGNVTLAGGAGNDTLIGGAGDDSISGGDHDDSLTGGDGNDTLLGGSGKDSIAGGDDSDSLDGDAGNDMLSGGLGDDTLKGGLNNDSLDGGGGNDVLDGQDGNDTLSGGADRDLLIGGIGSDSLKGEAGGDILIGGTTSLSTADFTAVMAEWTSSNDYANRVAHLRNGSGGANGTTKLDSSTVQNDSATDTLSGNADLDWFFQSATDVLDAINGEATKLI